MNAKRHLFRTRLRTGPICLAFVVTALQFAQALESSAPTVSPGETIAEVVGKLGRPRGMIERRNRITYSYDRGMVNFIDGRVVSAFLLTPEEAEQRRANQERAAEASRRQAEQLHQRLLVESQAELQKQKADLMFDKRPAAERLAYWEGFHRRYPFADVAADLAAAQAAVAAETGSPTKETEVNILSARVDAIEARRIELDAAYAASLANWKRNEIDAERAKLATELENCLRRLVELRDSVSAVNTNAAATPATGR